MRLPTVSLDKLRTFKSITYLFRESAIDEKKLSFFHIDTDTDNRFLKNFHEIVSSLLLRTNALFWICHYATNAKRSIFVYRPTKVLCAHIKPNQIQFQLYVYSHPFYENDK